MSKTYQYDQSFRKKVNELIWVYKEIKRTERIINGKDEQPTYLTRGRLISLLYSFRTTKNFGLTRKLCLKLINISKDICPFTKNQDLVRMDKIVKDWKDNGLTDEEIEIGSYYRVVSQYQIYKDAFWRYQYSQSMMDAPKPFTIKIIEKTEYGNFRGVTKYTTDEYYTIYASQLRKATDEQGENMELERRENIICKLENQMDSFQKNMDNYAILSSKIQDQIDESDWSELPTIKQDRKGYFEINNSL